MELYILTCTNEIGAIVSLDVFTDQPKARRAMLDGHFKKVAELKKAGHYKDTREYTDQCSATAGDDEKHYDWRIWIREV